MSMTDVARRARDAAFALGACSLAVRNATLEALRKNLEEDKAKIEAANAMDLEEAKKNVASGSLSEALVQRLGCSGKKFESMLKGVESVAKLPDPIGKCDLHNELSEGLHLYRVSCPIGVLAIIFEARPEAAVQIASLALKSGNALILKGGKEATHSNHAIFNAMKKALKACGSQGVPIDAIQMVDSREAVQGLLSQDKYVDLVIPRGSNALVQHIKDNTKIPVLGHADGLCTVYVDKSADLDLAVKIVDDAKNNYPAACNACETLLVHSDVVSTFLPKLAEGVAPMGVEFHADPTCFPYLPKDKTKAAVPEDFDTEFLCRTMAVKVVGGVKEAVDHINAHGSHHTDAIVAQDEAVASQFLAAVDSADVFHNCSTRFADGFRFGFGAEVGISTNRIHSRGPVGLDGLVIYKYRLRGSGHTVGDFDKGERTYTHKQLIPDALPLEHYERK